METETTKRLFNVDEYHRMAEAGIFGPCERLELIEGEIVQMSAPGVRHSGCVMCATYLFGRALGERAIVDVQNPVRLNRYTEPQPDIAVLQYRADFYRQEFPTAKDTLLVIEVSQSSLMYDRDVKVPLY